MKVLFDANVLVSAYGNPGVCRRLYMTCIQKHSVYVSPYILEEMSIALIQKFHIPEDDVKKIIASIHFTCKVIRDVEEVPVGSCDRKDDPILAAALHCNADYLVTGDLDLLTLKAYHGIPIIAPGVLTRTDPAFKD